MSKKKIAHLAEGSDELKNWANTLAKCASRCVSVSSKSNLYDACVDALRVVCFEIDQETVEKIVANYESIKADVLLKKSNADVLERSSKKKNKKTKKRPRRRRKISTASLSTAARKKTMPRLRSQEEHRARAWTNQPVAAERALARERHQSVP